MKRIAIIPARGGSKRIPGKNIKDFFGKPIIAYAIELAINSKLFDQVFVSTDSKEIRDISISHGANVSFMRSRKTAGDNATIYSTLEEVLTNFRNQRIYFDYCCNIFPISPLIQKEVLEQGFEFLIKSPRYDSVLPIGKYGHPIERSFETEKRSNKISISKNFIDNMTQDFPKRYFDTGQFCWFNVNQILKKKSLITDKTYGMILNEFQFQDVDNIIDWDILKMKFLYKNKIYE